MFSVNKALKTEITRIVILRDISILGSSSLLIWYILQKEVFWFGSSWEPNLLGGSK
jgi:hypothetical protein